MSTRPPVDRQRIQQFLEALGARFRSAGRVYLVGGTTLVYAGFRAPTLAIDLAYDLAARHHGDFIRTERELKNELEPNSKAASPGDFFPLPEGSAQRARFIGRFGQLDVFHFDPYSVALSQIERGRVADFAAVLALRGHGWIEFEALQTRCRESLPRVGGTQPEGRSGGIRTQVCLFAEPLAGRSPGGPLTYVRATHPSVRPGNRAARPHGAAGQRVTLASRREYEVAAASG